MIPPQKLPLYQVNAFSQHFNAGNPAGVVPLETFLDDELMIAIAKENGYAETAFFTERQNAGTNKEFNLRWFTPSQEVALCGHATLATAYVLAYELGIKQAHYCFHTLSGPITVSEKDGWFTLDMPASKPAAAPLPNRLREAIEAGLYPSAVNTIGDVVFDTDYLIVLDSAADVARFKPDFIQLQQTDARGVMITATSDKPDVDFVSRWFGGKGIGIDEDPVTGSAHCLLVPYWANKLGKATLHAEQVSPRGGHLQCAYDKANQRVHMAGQACLYLKGEITIA